MRAILFGAEVADLLPEFDKHPGLEVVKTEPDVIVCYGGDGTLLSAELRWPGIPKVPIRNSKRGNRCIAHPAVDVIAHLSLGTLVRTEYMKLEGAVRHSEDDEPLCYLSAMNEFNVHMGRINSAVRFRLWINDEPYDNGVEIIGDGFVLSTPFGSTAYYNQITRGVFYSGMGLALKSTAHHTNHLVVPDDARFRVLITRGPAVLAFDNSPEYFQLEAGDELDVRRHDHPATLLTWREMPYQTDEF